MGESYAALGVARLLARARSAMTADGGSLVVVTASNAGHRFSARRDVEQAPSPGASSGVSLSE